MTFPDGRIDPAIGVDYPASSLFADYEAFLHEALGECDPLLVLQLTGKLADGESRGVQRKIQSLAKEAGENNAPGSDVEADGVVTGVHPVDNPAARPNDVPGGERSRLKEVHNLTRRIERELPDQFIHELIHDGAYERLVDGIAQYRHHVLYETLPAATHKSRRQWGSQTFVATAGGRMDQGFH
jgi:hypothetical protein